MRHSLHAGALLLLGALSAGCIGFPVGPQRLRAPAAPAPDGLDRPLVFTGEIVGQAGRLGLRMAEGAVASSRLRARRLLAPVLPQPGSGPRPPLRRLDPTDPAAYAALASRLPPHYLARFRILLDASGLPDEERLRGLARGHALFGLLFSPLPLHPIRVAATCDLELFRAGRGPAEPLAAASLAGERRLVGNLWWLQGSYRVAARRALEGLALDCARALRREALAGLDAARSAQAPAPPAPRRGPERSRSS